MSRFGAFWRVLTFLSPPFGARRAGRWEKAEKMKFSTTDEQVNTDKKRREDAKNSLTANLR
jgi:hypothetical protein